MIEELIAVLKAAGVEPELRELRDALWLAEYVRIAAPDDQPAAPSGETATSIAKPTPPASDYATPDDEPASSTPAAPGAELYAASAGGGGSADLEGMETRSPAVPALRHQLNLARALRPFKRRVPSQTSFTVDEDATATRVAEEGIWLPVLRPVSARWLDLALVVEASPSMVMWRRTIAELQTLAERLAAFRTVRAFAIDGGADPSNLLTIRPGSLAGDAASPRQEPATLIEPTRRQAVLVVTDSVSSAWRDGRMDSLLRRWGTTAPVAVATLLPQRMWAGTGLHAVAAQLHTPKPGAANRALGSRARRMDRSALGPVPIPVMELSVRWLAHWAQIVAGAPGWHGAALLATSPAAIPVPPSTGGSASELVARFRTAASPTAFRLACYLSAAWLNLPVMRLVQRVMLPQSDTVHLAEVFLGGLLKAASTTSAITDPETVQYEFLPGVRDELNNYLLRDEMLGILRETSSFVSERFGHPLDFPALLADPEGTPLPALATGGGPPLAHVAATVLAKLGGRYRVLADRLAAPSIDRRTALDEQTHSPVTWAQDPTPETTGAGVTDFDDQTGGTTNTTTFEALVGNDGQKLDLPSAPAPALTEIMSTADVGSSRMTSVPKLPGPRLALVIATSSYADPGLAQLRAAQDAAEMIGVLADPDIGGFDVTAVLDRSEYEIRRAVDAFLTDRSRDDLVVVYLSCHGVLDSQGRLYFAATDTVETRLGSTAVESAWLLDRLDDCQAHQQVVILDCSYSGAFAQTEGSTEVDLERRLVGAGRGRAVLTASGANQASYEGTTGSVFTTALVDGLRSGNADGDGDGHISVEDAYAYAVDQVKAAKVAQSPQRWLYGAEGEIILARNPAAVVVTTATLPEALRLSLDSPYPDIRLGAVATLGEWLTSADPGKVLTAQQALQEIASHDSPTVATAARDLLRAAEPAAPPAPAQTADHPSKAPLSTHQVTDRIPPAAVPQRCLRVIEGHTGRIFHKSVWAVAFSPDGHLLASGGNDDTVRLWNPETGRPIGQPLTGHTAGVRTVAFSPDGRVLASGGNDNTVRLWNPTTGDPIGQPLTGHTGPVWAVAFSPDGRVLASGGNDKTVRMWNPTTGDPIGQPLTGHTGPVWAVAFSPDGHLLASGGNDKTVRMWDYTTGRALRQPFTGHTDWVRAVAFSPDGHLLASGGDDSTMRLWDPTTGRALRQPLTGHTDWVRAVAFSPDGHLLASAAGSTMRLWDPTTGRPIGRPLTGHTDLVVAVAFSPDGHLLASAGRDKTVRLWGP